MRIIYQGDQYAIPVLLKTMNGAVIDNTNASAVRIKIGGKSAYWPDGNLTYQNDAWQFPLTQAASYKMLGQSVEFQAQVRYVSGEIFSSKTQTIPVGQSIFKDEWEGNGADSQSGPQMPTPSVIATVPNTQGAPLSATILAQTEGQPSDYNYLVNKPAINGTTIQGDQNGAYYGLVDAPLSAVVGELLQVSAVDETGLPTSWETVQIAAEAAQGDERPISSGAVYTALENAEESMERAEQAAREAQTAAANAAASQALADQYAAAAALARQAAETAATAASSAKTSAEAAKASAIASAQAAAADKLAADASAAAAQAAEQAALASQAAAAASAAAAAGSEQSAADNAAAAIAARDAAQRAQEAAQASQTAAAASAEAAANSAAAAQTAASDAAQSAQAAAASATGASGSATAAESWAVGGTGTRTGEDTDNAQYYAEQAGDANTDVQAARTAIQDSIDGVAQEDTAQQILTLVEQIVESGGGASDLNGFGLTLDQSDNSVNLTYTNPTTGEEYDPAKLPTDTTAMQIAAALQAFNTTT